MQESLLTKQQQHLHQNQERQKHQSPSSTQRQIKHQEIKSNNKHQELKNNSKKRTFQMVSFRQCIQEVGRDGKYQKKMFLLMAIFWISASMFLSFPFYLFQKPMYYLNNPFQTCSQYDQKCIHQVCKQYYPNKIYLHIVKELTFSYKFGLFCDLQPIRILYKSLTEIFSFVGLLIYGYIADFKGRQVALKISWRFYAIGVVIFSMTQTQFLITFGYVLASVNCFASLIIQFIIMFEESNNQLRLKSSLLVLSSLFIGSLLCAFFADAVIKLVGIRLTLFAMCGLPAIFLSFALNNIQQSAKFLYKKNKIKAFNVVNQIAKKNEKDLILIDLSKSEFIKFQNYEITLKQLFKFPKMTSRLLTMFLFVLSAYFSIKTAQVTLDNYTQSHFRGILMNVATAAADLFLIFTQLRISIKYLFMIDLTLYCVLVLVLNFMSQTFAKDVIMIILLFSLRFFAQMAYGTLLILIIQNSPTVVRGQAVGFVLSAMSISCGTVYLLKNYSDLLSIIGLLISVFAIWMQSKQYVVLQKTGKILDTIKGKYYDDEDKFFRLKITQQQQEEQ